MAQALHDVAIGQLSINHPAFHGEYLVLVKLLINLLQNLARAHPQLTEFSSLSEEFDIASQEAYLQLAIADDNNSYQPQIYLHHDHKFVIGAQGSGISVATASQAFKVISSKIDSFDWIKQN